jgi:uncharacterized protein YhaN
LEEAVARALEVLERLQAENAELSLMVRQLRDDLEGLKKENCAKGEIIEHLEKDRLEIRSRVGAIIDRIAALERPVRIRSRSWSSEWVMGRNA